MAEYVARVADRELTDRLRSSGAVLIDGPKACGKTETAKREARSVFRLDVDSSVRTAVSAAPEALFASTAPILFDEWQAAPGLWNLVRREVDDRSPTKGQFILTGSATPADDVNRHSGAGRIATVRMRPMSLYETGQSTGEVSLARLFDGEMPSALDPGLTVPDLIDRIVIGGWPALMGAEVGDAQRWVRDYLSQIVEVDVPTLGSRREPEGLRRLLVSLGRGVGTPLTVKAMTADVGGENAAASPNTVTAYLEALRRLMIVEDVPAWAPHMRSATPLRKAATRFMADPSLAIAALRTGPAQLLADLNATGFHFEALAVRDLRVHAQPLGGELRHWRDQNGNEVDCIIVLDDGRWGAFEVKMNPDDVDRAAQSLLQFSARVDTGRMAMGEPAFLGVLTTRALAHRRQDGVVVVPIATLGP